MNKRYWMIALALVLIAALGFVGVVSAQTPEPPTPGQGAGRMMGGRGGMMGAGGGVMHEYMQPLLAQALGMTEEALNQAHADGKTFWQIAEEKGLTEEEAQQVMVDARSQALDAMVKDNVITQEQADWMKNRMGTMRGFGHGGCMGSGQPGSRLGTPRGMRW